MQQVAHRVGVLENGDSAQWRAAWYDLAVALGGDREGIVAGAGTCGAAARAAACAATAGAAATASGGRAAAAAAAGRATAIASGAGTSAGGLAANLAGTADHDRESDRQAPACAAQQAKPRRPGN